MNLGDSPADFEFTVTDYLQRLETWANVARFRHTDASAVLATAERFTSAVLVPVCGKAVQKRGSRGFDPDGIMRQKARFRYEARAYVQHASVIGWMPEQHEDNVAVTVASAGNSSTESFPPGALFTLGLDLDVAAGVEAEFTIDLSSSFQPSSRGESTDTRHIGCILVSVEFS